MFTGLLQSATLLQNVHSKQTPEVLSLIPSKHMVAHL